MKLGPLHHVTAVCSDARRTAEFYRDLGFRLVKKTVNFDDPQAYHLYFGDEGGPPGSLVTFFEWPQSAPGTLGRGFVETIGLTLPGQEARSVDDPDGLHLELVPGARPGLAFVRAFGGDPVYAELLEEGAPLSFTGPPGDERGVYGPGVTHHVAFRVPDEEEQRRWQERLRERGLSPTEVLDRKYFRSIYVRMPDGLLVEIATDGPGFAVDERAEALGETLTLPPWLEGERELLERVLTPL